MLQQVSSDVVAEGSQTILAVTTSGQASGQHSGQRGGRESSASGTPEVGRADDSRGPAASGGTPGFVTPRSSHLHGVSGFLGTGSQQASSAQTGSPGLGRVDEDAGLVPRPNARAANSAALTG